jgi:hypothetical protein
VIDAGSGDAAEDDGDDEGSAETAPTTTVPEVVVDENVYGVVPDGTIRC